MARGLDYLLDVLDKRYKSGIRNPSSTTNKLSYSPSKNYGTGTRKSVVKTAEMNEYRKLSLDEINEKKKRL